MDGLGHVDREQVSLSGHDEIVPVKTPDSMGPPGDSYSSPLCQDRRMMALRFGQFSKLDREGQSGCEVFELEDSLKTLDPVLFGYGPPPDRWAQLIDLINGEGGFSAATWYTLRSG